MNSWVCIRAYVSACNPQHNNDNWPIRWQREALTPGAQAEPDETWQNNETETGRMQINCVSLSYILNYKNDTVQGRNKRSSFWKMLWHCIWKQNTNSCWVPYKFTQKLKLFSFQYFVLCNKLFLAKSHNGSQLLINNKPWIYCEFTLEVSNCRRFLTVGQITLSMAKMNGTFNFRTSCAQKNLHFAVLHCNVNEWQKNICILCFM